jgi:hypothetical protein
MLYPAELLSHKSALSAPPAYVRVERDKTGAGLYRFHVREAAP